MIQRMTILICLIFGLASFAHAAEPEVSAPVSVGVIVNMAGTISLSRNGGSQAFIAEDPVMEGDRFTTGEDGKLQLLLLDDTILNLGVNTEIVLTKIPPPEQKTQARIDLVTGHLRLGVGEILGAQQQLQVYSPTMIASVSGTEFFVIYDPVVKATQVITRTGVVRVRKLSEAQTEETKVSAQTQVEVSEEKSTSEPSEISLDRIESLIREIDTPQKVSDANRAGGSVQDIPKPSPNAPGQPEQSIRMPFNSLSKMNQTDSISLPPVHQDPTDLPVILTTEDRETVIIKAQRP